MNGSWYNLFMLKLQIRRYQISDLPVVWELHTLGLAEIGANPSYGSSWDKDLDDIENIYLKEGDFIVGEYQGRVVAMGAFKKISNEIAEVKRIRVHPDYQRRGFGQIIIEELEERAKKLGYKKLVLDSSPKWKKAQKFYRKNGYIEVKRGLIANKYAAIFYEKELK